MYAVPAPALEMLPTLLSYFLCDAWIKGKIREYTSWRKNFYVYSLASLYVIKCARQFDLLCMFYNIVFTGVLPTLASSRQGGKEATELNRQQYLILIQSSPTPDQPASHIALVSQACIFHQ